MNVKINVTQRDIDAHGDSATTCPVARAARRRLPKSREIWVGKGRMNVVSATGASRWVEMPIEAARFVENYDNGCAVSPFQFEISIDE